jgi:hypothetical protein
MLLNKKEQQILRNYIPNSSYQGLAKNEQLETYEEQVDISSRTDNVDGKNQQPAGITYEYFTMDTFPEIFLLCHRIGLN